MVFQGAATILLLMVAAGLSTRYTIQTYLTERQLAREHVVHGKKTVLDHLCMPLLLPGVFPLYVVGMLTGSPFWAWTAFFGGMAVCYGGVGLIIDIARHVFFR